MIVTENLGGKNQTVTRRPWGGSGGFLSDPTPAMLRDFLDCIREGRSAAVIPAQSARQTLAIANAGVADAINIHANWAGGFPPALHRARIAALGGMGVMIGSTHYLGIGAAAYQFLSPLMPGDLPCEQVNVEIYGGKGIVNNPFLIREGRIHIEDRPGIGIEPNLEALHSRCHQKHEIAN